MLTRIKMVIVLKTTPTPKIAFIGPWSELQSKKNKALQEPTMPSAEME